MGHHLNASTKNWRYWIGGLALGIAALATAWVLLLAPQVDHSRTYRIAFGGDEPMHFAAPDGSPKGLAVEIVQAAAKQVGIKLEWVFVGNNQSADVDLWVLKSIVRGRPTSLYYSAPYLQAESCFLVPNESPIRDIPDLIGARISYVDFGVHRATLPQLIPRFEPVPTNSTRDAVSQMLKGRADVAYLDQYTLFATLLAGDQRPLRVLPTHSPTRQLALAARPAYRAVADEIRTGMQLLVEQGTLAEITKRWIFFPNLTAGIIGDSAKEYRQRRWQRIGITILSTLLVITAGLSILAQHRKNQWRKSEQKHRRLHESMTDAFAQFDLQGRIEETNPAYCDLLGYSDQELRQLSQAEITPEKWHAQDRIIFEEQVLRHGFSIVYEKEFRRKDGDIFPAELRCFLLHDTLGKPTGFWAIVRDISERKRAENERDHLHQQLAQSQKMETVGRLAGGVAHDFNNMLQAILGNTALLLEDVPKDSPLCGPLQEIQNAAKRSADLTRQLLGFARKQTVTPQVLDLNKSVADMLQLLRRLIGERIEIVWRPAADLWPVKIDPSQLDQILSNLCVNARDAIQNSGTVTLATANLSIDEAYCATHEGHTPGDFVVLTVSDTGAGINPAAMSHLFEPFFTTKEAGAGTGLGLAMVYGVVTQNGGIIKVASTPATGTSFTVFLPRVFAAPSPADDENHPTTTPPPGHGTILLVEDETPVLKISKTMLTKAGYHVLTASTPEAALRIAEQMPGKIDLLVTDVIMPGMNGRQLADHLYLRHPGIKRIFMSGYAADLITTDGILGPDVHFLPKPFSSQALINLVQTTLDRRPATRHPF